METRSANTRLAEDAQVLAFQIVPTPIDATGCVQPHELHPGSALPVTARCWQRFHHGVLHGETTQPLAENPAWWVDCVHDATTLSACVLVRPQLPCFAGHFPGQPILPGVVQLQWVAELAGRVWPDTHPSSQLAGVSRLKFKAPIAPGDRLLIKLSAKQTSISAAIVDAASQLTSATLKYRHSND